MYLNVERSIYFSSKVEKSRGKMGQYALGLQMHECNTGESVTTVCT